MTDTIVPPVLYLPLHASSTPDRQLVEVRELKDGRQALLAYTALDRLADKCGPEQPWILVQTEDIGEIKKAQPYDVVIFDLDVPEQYRSEGRIA
jgi:hypothetical protein